MMMLMHWNIFGCTKHWKYPERAWFSQSDSERVPSDLKSIRASHRPIAKLLYIVFKWLILVSYSFLFKHQSIRSQKVMEWTNFVIKYFRIIEHSRKRKNGKGEESWLEKAVRILPCTKPFLTHTYSQAFSTKRLHDPYRHFKN